MTPHLAVWRWLVGALMALACISARADTPIALFKSFAGNVNFVGTQKTMRSAANGANACSAVSATTALTATLAGIPAGATILSAQLYWAASSSSPDYTITFEGNAVTASRQYQSNTVGYAYFGGAADVTSQVTQKRNGDYTFLGLTVNTGSPYCSVEGVLGGFSLLVIYSEPTEPFRVLNLYEGFQYIQYSGVTLNLSNFKIPTPIGTATGRVGHITWEGDATLGANGEDLEFNGYEMTDALNPAQNQFNSKSNINDDSSSYGIDFDAYTVASPVIAAGQTTASTRYQSGQDLVLLNAEIIAVPNVPVADLGITMTLDDNPLTLGQSSNYHIVVSNNGPFTETGPIVVSDTLPTALSPVTAGGSGWICSIASQAVSCSYAGSLAVGATLPEIVIGVTTTSAPAGGVLNTAAVAGQLFDNVPANSSASVSATITAPPNVFTDQVCTHGIAFGNASQPCKILSLGPKAAGAPVPGMFITALNSSGIPTRKSNSSVTNTAFQFALSCHKPTADAGRQATFTLASTTTSPIALLLPLCKGSGLTPTTWSNSATVSFPKGSPSVALENSFAYPDVGTIELFMKDSAGTASTGKFASVPATLQFSAIKRKSDGAVNPAPTSFAGLAFVRSGELFVVTANAIGFNNETLPNFGNEGEKFDITAVKSGDAVSLALMNHVPKLTGSFAAIAAGAASGDFSFADVGILALTPSILSGDYLGTGLGKPTNCNGSSTPMKCITVTSVGRFYPDHFDTVTTAPFVACLASMGCPADVSGAAYSSQPFGVKVTARNAAGDVTSNFIVNAAGDGFAKDVTLGAYNQRGGSIVNPPAGVGAMVGNTVAKTAFVAGEATIATPRYALAVPYSSSTASAAAWTPPTSIYLRAAATDGSYVASAASCALSSFTSPPMPPAGYKLCDTSITSNRGSSPIEGGIRVINGRLQLANAYGSERIKMPVAMQAQFWNSTGRWELNSLDVSQVDPSLLTFANCTQNLATSATPPACKSVVQVNSPAVMLTLALGRTIGWMNAPGVGNNGRTDIQLTGPTWYPWLPSTVGRMVFGVYTSPVIYIREVY